MQSDARSVLFVVCVTYNRSSVLGQDWSETKKNRSSSCTHMWSWSCRSGVVLWNMVLLRSSSYWSWRTQQLFKYYL